MYGPQYFLRILRETNGFCACQERMINCSMVCSMRLAAWYGGSTSSTTVLSHHWSAEPNLVKRQRFQRSVVGLGRFVQLFVCKCFRRASYVFNCAQMITYLWRYALFDSALSLQQDFVWVLQHVSRKSVYFTNEKIKLHYLRQCYFLPIWRGVQFVLRFLRDTRFYQLWLCSFHEAKSF